MPVYLETPRLILRQFTANDEENLYELDSDPAVMRYLTGGVPTARAAIHDDILPTFLRSYEHWHGFGIWAMVEKQREAFLGWVSMRPPPGGSPANAELGYRLRQAAWGHGYATEGARALIHQGFTELGMQRVFATTYQDNHASLRVMEKVGMRLVRTYRITQAELAAADTFTGASLECWDGDDVEYALLKADWVPEPNALP